MSKAEVTDPGARQETTPNAMAYLLIRTESSEVESVRLSLMRFHEGILALDFALLNGGQVWSKLECGVRVGLSEP